MKCLFCGAYDSKVIDSRLQDEDNSIRRRRECIKCGKRFTTYEKIETTPMLVIKKDGSRQIFNRDKIKQGLIKACEKRQISMQQIDGIIDEVEKQILNMLKQEVSSSVIGELIMKQLQEIDEVAYIRFASVYRQFADITHFEKFLNSINKN